MFDNLKSRLGFDDEESPLRSFRKNRNDDYDDNYDDGYDTYDDEYADEGDFDDYDDEYAEYGPDYDDRPSRAYETPREKVERASSFSTTSNARGAYRNSNLVTIDDVKAHAATLESSNRETSSTRSYGSRTVLDERKPAPQTPVAQMAAASASEDRHSQGLNSLFTPTTEEPASYTASTPTASTQNAWGSWDSYNSYESTASSYTPARGISVLKPVSYSDAERITRSLKSGDAVVISLRNTPDDLSKRILDFSFGVASALDASVDCPGEKVFAITRGSGLSESEKQALVNQGVL